jgi:hypothetical protein
MVILKQAQKLVESRAAQAELRRAEAVFQKYAADGKEDYQGNQRRMTTIIAPPGEEQPGKTMQKVGSLASKLFEALPPELKAFVKEVGTG